jgi:HTH-type transcriptional regulator/antitoxin HipB
LEDRVRLRNPKDVGAFIRDQRRSSGLSQDALAHLAGVSRRWLSALEAGKPGAELGLVLRVLAALEIDLEAKEPARGRDVQHPVRDGGAATVDLNQLVAEFDRPRR